MWGVWCHTDRPKWMQDPYGTPRAYADRIDAVIATNAMRRQVRGLFRYEARELTGADLIPTRLRSMHDRLRAVRNNARWLRQRGVS